MEDVEEIRNLTSEQLALEPKLIRRQLTQLNEETERLAFANYKTFISAAQCSRSIHDDIAAIERQLDTISDDAPSLREECEAFQRHAAQVSRARAANVQARKKRDEILQLLEIPSLMEACVRAGQWEKALQLCAHQEKLQRRFGTRNLPVIQQASVAVTRTRELMRTQLIDELRGTLTLAQCLKCVQHLRALGVYSDAHLQLVFFAARTQWLRNVIKLGDAPRKSIDDAYVYADEVYEKAVQLIEAGRVNLFDICTHYKAVFSVNHKLLGDWLHGHIKALLHAVETLLASVDVIDRLDSVILHCMYFGSSFGRLGFDFRPHVLPIIERIVLTRCHSTWRAPRENMCAFLQQERWSERVKVPTTFELGSIDAQRDWQASQGDGRATPHALLVCTPLALYCNALIKSLNTVRACCPLTLVPRLISDMSDDISIVTKTLGEQEHSSAAAYVAYLIRRQLVPFINHCLRTVFDPRHICKSLGLGVDCTDYAYHVLSLKTDFIIEPLFNAHLLQFTSGTTSEQSRAALRPAKTILESKEEGGAFPNERSKEEHLPSASGNEKESQNEPTLVAFDNSGAEVQESSDISTDEPKVQL